MMKRCLSCILLCFLVSCSVTTAGVNDTLYIVYTANINGMIQNCDCGKEPLGGMARIKSFIDKIRARSAQVIVIDGGDYFNTYPFIELNKAMGDIQSLVNYDAILPGDQALVEGVSFFEELQEKNTTKWVISNLKNFPQLSKKISTERFNVEISGYLSPHCFSFIPLPEDRQLLEFNEVFSDIRPRPEKAKKLNVVVVHGSEEEARIIRDTYPWIDLVLIAHTQYQTILGPVNRPIVGCGKDGEYVALIKITMNDSHRNYLIEFVKMYSGIMEDPTVLSIIHRLDDSLSD